MAAFKFRLGRLSRVRDIQEHGARNLWAAAEAVASNHQEVVQHFLDEIQRARLELARAQAEEAIEIGSVLCTHDLIEKLEERLHVARERAKTSRFQADQLKDSWIEAKNEALALERLEERARSDYQREEQRLENAQMDQVALERSSASTRLDRPQTEDSTR